MTTVLTGPAGARGGKASQEQRQIPRWGILVFPSASALSAASPALRVHQEEQRRQPPLERAGEKEPREAAALSARSCPPQGWWPRSSSLETGLAKEALW